MKKLIVGMVLGFILSISSTTLANTAMEVIAKFASFNIVIDGNDVDLETQPLIYNGTTYLPVRELGNLLGYDVTYKSDTRTIELNTSTQATINNDVILTEYDVDGATIMKALRKYEGEKTLPPNGLLKFNDYEIQLSTKIKDRETYYDITPLLENGILTTNDLSVENSSNQEEQTNNASNINDFTKLYVSINNKSSSSTFILISSNDTEYISLRNLLDATGWNMDGYGNVYRKNFTAPTEENIIFKFDITSDNVFNLTYNNTSVKLTNPIIKHNGYTFIPLNELEKLELLTYSLDKNKKEITITSLID